MAENNSSDPGRASPRQYPPELKARATRMVLESFDRGSERQGLVTRIARQLDIGPESLRRWVVQAEIDRGGRAGTTSEEAQRISELERENRELRRANEILKSRLGFLRGGARPPTATMTRYIDAHRDIFGVEPICQVLAIAPSTYYAAKSRPPSARALRDAELKPSISRVHAGNFAVYGTRKVWRQLCREGVEVGRDRVARLMGELGLCGATRTKKVRTTIPAPVSRATSRSRRAGLHGQRSRPPLGGRPDLCLDAGWLLLCGLRHRCLQPPHRGLAGLILATHRPRPRCPRDGHLQPG